MRIAIIGCGVSGLAAAHYLRGHDHEVTIYERSARLGGNADTVEFELDSDATLDGQKLRRWGDLGVNDFNKVTYVEVIKVMDEIGVEYKPLVTSAKESATHRATNEDQCSYFTEDGAVCFTTDGGGNTRMPARIKEASTRFEAEAWGDAAKPEYHSYTIKQYLDEKKYPPDFGPLYLFARVNAMYYTDEVTPTNMPFIAVMQYFHMQEGYGTSSPPERQYFVNGTRVWIEKLAKWVSAPNPDKRLRGVTIKTNRKAHIRADRDKVVVVSTRNGSGNKNEDREEAEYDKVLLTCHASDALGCFERGITEEIVNVLRVFPYLNSEAVMHTYTGVMPPSYNAWRAYNVLIRRGESMRPYSMSYVENRHQNDGANPLYNAFGMPQYFITLNPYRPIPDQFVIKDTDGKPAKRYFQHNVLNHKSLEAQTNLPKIQGINNVFYAGGWTSGAGLQEQCWVSAQDVAALMVGDQTELQEIFRPEAGAAGYLPRSLRAR
jgi:predicted NAD/FAD-binding protein